MVLICSKGICNTRTLYRFKYEHPGGEEFEATLLEKSPKCPEAAVIAVIGVDARAVRLISPQDDHSPLSEELESRARRVLKESGAGQGALPSLADSAPEVKKVGRVTLLTFRTETDDTAAVLLLNNNFVSLGLCTFEHLFFSLNDKLHLTYRKGCCACGEVINFVYDLSGEAPKKVYGNAKFSD